MQIGVSGLKDSVDVVKDGLVNVQAEADVLKTGLAQATKHINIIASQAKTLKQAPKVTPKVTPTYSASSLPARSSGYSYGAGTVSYTHLTLPTIYSV